MEGKSAGGERSASICILPALLLGTEWPAFWALVWENKRGVLRDIAANHGLILGNLEVLRDSRAMNRN